MKRSFYRVYDLFKSINRSVIAMLMLAFAFTGCEYEDEWSPYQSKAVLSGALLTYHPTTISGTTTGDPSFLWVVQVLEGRDFCSAVSQTGSVGNPFALSVTANMSSEERVAVVKITFSDGYSNTFTIRQLAKTDNPDYDHPWAEQPDYKPGSELVYKTYYTKTVGGKRVRNYSICYDTDKLVSHWVAYPVHKMYMDRGDYKAKNNNGRTDAWAFDDAVCQYISSSPYYEVVRYDYTDPVIPQSQQWYATATYGSGYARGHMLPSATRYMTYNTNAQTFYSTNIMPQEYDFNGGSWANLEGKVRNWACNDTLFVVTGTLFEGNRTLSKNGRTTLVPSHAYKLVLRTKRGNTGKHISEITSASELKAIAFLYKNDASEAETMPSEAAVSVAEIERRSGFVFFRNLDPKIADEVKAQKNLNDWGL